MPAKLTARQARKYGIAGTSKYRNRKTVVDGIMFDSKKEAERWFVLKDMEAKREIWELNRQIKWPLEVEGVLVAIYICDFTYLSKGGRIIEDVKGFRTPVYRLKKKLMKAIYGIDIQEI